MRVLAVLLAMAAAWLVVVPPQRVRLVAVLAGGSVSGSLRTRVQRLGASAVARVGLGPASRRRRAEGRVRAVQALGALAAELESGQPPQVALVRACGRPPVWPHALSAVRLDGDVAEALERDAHRHEVLRQAAACWRIADHGSGLAASMTRVAASARVAEDVRVEMEGQLAGPRATARTLAILPLVGMGFGVMLGSDPIGWLLGSTAGRACLGVAIGLTVLGTWWTGRIASAVERQL